MEQLTAHDDSYIFVSEKLIIKKGSVSLRKGQDMETYYMTVKEFCERMQVSPSTVYRMIKNHMIPAVKFVRYWKIPGSVFENIHKN